MLNDDTFGNAGPATQQSIGRDFDFAGQTAKIANTLQEEQMVYQARAPMQQKPPIPHASKPTRTGYESYQDPEYIPRLEARADIWGLQPKQSPAPRHQEPLQQVPAPSRKMMSLEEVEAMMRQQPLQGTPPQVLQQQQHIAPSQSPMPAQYPHPMPHGQPPYQGMPNFPGQFPQQILQRPQQQHPQGPQAPRQQQVHAELPGQPVHTQAPQQPTILQRPRQLNEPAIQQQRPAHAQGQPQRPPSQPRHILQNPNRLSGQGQPVAHAAHAGPRGPPPGHNRGPSFPGMVITHPEQLMALSQEERDAYIEAEAKRAKRNHKISLLAKDNGLMTPQDKNFITRIQLQQLMTATGNVEERGSEAAIAEDFYYHVMSQIRGGARQNPHQPANQFAQTYLFQTNSRFGLRRNGRGGDNHMQRMEQQVQRAVEAAKAKPKGKQLVIEGSLGKIAFSNAKTPRPLLNIKRPEIGDKHPKNHKSSVAHRKQTLRNIEAIYMTLMRIEDVDRAVPPPIREDSPPEAIQAHMEWRSKIETLRKELWHNMRIMEPINPQ